EGSGRGMSAQAVRADVRRRGDPYRGRGQDRARDRDSGRGQDRDREGCRNRDRNPNHYRDQNRNRRHRSRRRNQDRGQVTVECLGMMPTILVTLVVLWQLVLVGYTYTLAGNAADEAARAATAAAPGGARDSACQEAGGASLSGAWAGGA